LFSEGMFSTISVLFLLSPYSSVSPKSAIAN
jgi:hypothetical protein